MSEYTALVWNASGCSCTPQREMSCLFIPAVHSSVAGSRKSVPMLTASAAKFSHLDFGYQSSRSVCWLVRFSLLPDNKGSFLASSSWLHLFTLLSWAIFSETSFQALHQLD